MKSFLISYLFVFLFKCVFTNPCDINNGHNSQNSIQFDENTKINSTLYTLPFEELNDIDTIRMHSSELDDKKLNEYFQIVKLNKLKLKSHYDLETNSDFIELLFTCESKPIGKQKQIFRNTFLLYVTINDVNDKVPHFLDTPYKFSLKELTPVGTIVYTDINAIDKDMQNRPNSQISFSIIKGPCSEFFEFPLSTKPEIAIVKPINFEMFNKCNLTIKAQDHGEPQLSSETTIQITIIDIDDKDPAFTHNYYKGSIARSSAIGSIVDFGQTPILAFDQDTGINMTLEYFLNTNPDEMFQINKYNAEIRLNKKITDFDIKEINLVVKSIQIDNKLRSSISMVKIQIFDINNYKPKFEKSFYEQSITENSEINTFVLGVQASDLDQNRIEYSIINNHESPFIVEKYSGIIRVNGRVDYEMSKEHLLELKASDGVHSDQTLVKINIINVIDKAPNFEYNYYNYKIKIPYDIFIGQVKAIDVENTSNMSYTIKFSNQNDSKLFCITQTGTIYLCTSNFGQQTKLEQVLLSFDKDEYKFNVSVRIYSDYSNGYLENSVECRIQVESKEIEKHGFELRTSTIDYNRAEATDFLRNYLIKDLKDVNIFVIIIAIVLLIMIGLFSTLVWIRCKQAGVYDKKLETSMDRSTRTKSTSGISCGSYSSTEKGAETPTMFLTDQSKITILSEYLNTTQNHAPRMSYYSDLLTNASNLQSNLSSPKLLSFFPPPALEQEKNITYNHHEPLMVSSEFNLDNSEIYLNDSARFHANLSSCNDSLAKLVSMMNQTDSSMISVSVDAKECDEYEVTSMTNEFDMTSSSWLSPSFSSAKLTSVTSSLRSNESGLSLSKLKPNPNMYKLFFNNYNDNKAKDSSYLSDITSLTDTVISESMINKVFYDYDKNESLAYV